MNSSDLREKFLKFFENRDHAIVSSSPLIPEGDPTTLFTGSGMQPMMPYLLGEKHPLGKRIANSQRCFRAEDIEEVGDNRHTTFFEMLGNWSLGDYWKEEQLSWFFEFLTREVGLPKEKIWVTCFEGDLKNNIPKDAESAEIWKKLGIPEERIRFYGSKNWWSRAGAAENMPAGEPGGPDSEVFYEFEEIKHDEKFGKDCHPNCDCGRFFEIGNSVFMEFKKNKDGFFEKLPQRNVDFGGGLERMAAVLNGNADIFKIDTLYPVIRKIEEVSGKSYEDDSLARHFRVIADHVRGVVFMLSEGVISSNTDRGYILRRILRRAIRSGDALGVPGRSFAEFSEPVIQSYGSIYENVRTHREDIKRQIAEEEQKFREALKRAMPEFEKIAKGKDAKHLISGEEAFRLHATYGLPPDYIEELAEATGTAVVKESFKAEMAKHRELSRIAAAGKFKGGLADASYETTRLHTAHHLLLRALQIVLGDHVKQRGSNITSERLRIDFLHGEKMTEEQKKEAERIVNEKIAEDLPVIRSEMALEEAEKLGAEHEFGQKYPAKVSVYSVGPKGATFENPDFERAFSIEFCGGPHVLRTGEIGKFKILKEESIAAGIRRIRGAVE